MKRLLIAVLTVALCATAVAIASAGSPPVSGGVIAGGALTQGSTTVNLSRTRGFLMEWVKAAPGASFGWHFHRAAVAVAVTAGTLTLYDADDPSCRPHRYSTGQGFVEPPNRVHLARNEGTKVLALYATYIGVPPNWRANPTPLDAVVKAPGNCPANVR